jgi:hypothetical protein
MTIKSFPKGSTVEVTKTNSSTEKMMPLGTKGTVIYSGDPYSRGKVGGHRTKIRLGDGKEEWLRTDYLTLVTAHISKNESAIITTLGELRETIKEAMESLDEDSFEQARAAGPLRDFIKNLNEARMALGTDGALKSLQELHQSTTNPEGVRQVDKLLESTKKIDIFIVTMIRWLDRMPELTKDAWHGVGRAPRRG